MKGIGGIYIKWRTHNQALLFEFWDLHSYLHTNAGLSLLPWILLFLHPPLVVVNVTFEAIWQPLNGFVITWIENVFVFLSFQCHSVWLL